MKLRKAIEQTFSDCHPDYPAMVVCRYEQFLMREEEALRAVKAGYSSPRAAMADGIIEWCPAFDTEAR